MSEDTTARLEVRIKRLMASLLEARSENPPGDERAVADIIEDELRRLGISKVERVARDPRRPNIVARIVGAEPGPTLALCGHIDTKPAGSVDEWDYDPFSSTVVGDRLYGRGACDMKGGVAAIISALAEMQRASSSLCGGVVGLFLADEEGGSAFGAQHIVERGFRADGMIIAEPAGISTEWQHLYLGYRGSVLFKIEALAEGGHSSLFDASAGISAAEGVAILIGALRRAFGAIPGVSFNVATMESGVAYGVRPHQAAIRGDVRIPPGVPSSTVERVIQNELATLATDHPNVNVRIVPEIVNGAFEAGSISPDSPLVGASRTALKQVLGRVPPEGIYPAGSDAYFFQGQAGIPTIAAMGPGRLQEAHRPNEFVSFVSIVEAAAMYSAIAVRLLMNKDRALSRTGQPGD
jgi:acetylornithine deacetylase/succinyl-diaminopimelate desuccinylase-like protein